MFIIVIHYQKDVYFVLSNQQEKGFNLSKRNVTISTDIYGPQRMNHSDCVDPSTFSPAPPYTMHGQQLNGLS